MLSRFLTPAFVMVVSASTAQPATPLAAAGASTAVIDLGSRRELFVDDHLVERLSGKADLRLHQPVPRELVIVHDAPWEGTGSGYHSIFQDGDRYRMYYKGWMLTVSPKQARTDRRPYAGAYAESDDGIHWRKPALGLHAFRGSKANNIVFADNQREGELTLNSAHLAVFRDENPAAGADARYKAIILCKPATGRSGLVPFKSPDGLHWTRMSDQPVITDGAFDSQNLAFWDGVRGHYRAYWRYFAPGEGGARGARSIRTATSRDLITWDKPVDLRYVDSPVEELYTNQIKPYHRAPHLLLGFPTRYIDRGWSDSMRSLPEREHREGRAAATQRYGTAITEGLLMISRDGVNFKRWNEAFLPPGIEREGTWNYGHQYIGWHVVETKSSLEGAPNELSLYAVESYWTGDSSALRRYTLRMDGFVSVKAPMSGGELLTRPFTFAGRTLALNFATSAAGGVQVEIQDGSGRPLPGFSLEDCPVIFGDALDRVVTWKGGNDVSRLAGQPVRLRFVLRDADLYALQFQ